MEKAIHTPHINASLGDFAKTVLMPGDPKRSKFIADNFLENARLVNDVRGVQGYTGIYRGVAVSVMASGMGIPSIGIYSYELYTSFGVENIIRVGSCGGLSEDLRLRDIVFGMSASTTSNFGVQYGLEGILAPTASYDLLKVATRGGAAVLGRKDIGSLEVGKCADLFLIDSRRLELVGACEDVKSVLGTVGVRGAVDYTVVNGRVTVRGGKLAGWDEAALAAHFGL